MTAVTLVVTMDTVTMVMEVTMERPIMVDITTVAHTMVDTIIKWLVFHKIKPWFYLFNHGSNVEIQNCQ